MEIKWLEDFLALSTFGNFSKAADSRFITQPAFGRRIKALESWLGVALVDRQQYPTTLTAAGEVFVRQAQIWVDDFYGVRSQLREKAGATRSISFAAQHSLTVSFLPEWIKDIHSQLPDTLVRVEAFNLHDCLDSLLAGQKDFLLCYYSADVYPQLTRDDLLCVNIANDVLIPVSGAGSDGRAIFSPANKAVLPLLSYPDDSFFGRLLQREYFNKIGGEKQQFKTQCENALVEGLKALAVAGMGVAWLPKKVIQEELIKGTLIEIVADLPTIELKIMLYRNKSMVNQEAEVFWHWANRNTTSR